MTVRQDVVCPIETGEGDSKKTRWVKVGSAWDKGNGKWSIVLDALPTNGRLMIFPPKEQEKPRPVQDDIPF